ncbi:energy transducer TonB [uncultured Bradyrhizobium sp.]|mgnify:CR=1 FL=1|jgi:TonB family protein|uniref:energy transducer TonB family protein n=1 Tax=uncultured Bradyrhizobium sp. TaxID=199684 RepID=UPI002607FEBC|nr:energy transducer TonB [uncultured Bradyrhizobium sp.]
MSNIDIEAKPSRKLWILAAVAALALHLGGAALALANLRADPGDEGLGAAGADFAIEMTSPEAKESDLPPGPMDSVAQEERPALPEQKAETKQTELPQDRPQQEDDPDTVVTENKPEKEQDQTPKVAAVETPAMEASQKSVDMEQQTFEDAARESKKPTAQNSGMGKDNKKLTDDWNIQISAHLLAHQIKREDRKQNNQKVKVRFVINRVGNVLSVDVLESSQDPTFDATAIAMVRKSDPFPRPSPELGGDKFERTVDIVFKPPEDKKKKKKTAHRQ